MPLPQNHRPSSPQSASQNHTNQRPAPFAAPIPSVSSQRPAARPGKPVQQQSAPVEEPTANDNNMSFDFDDDGFEMSSEPVNPAAPMQSPANQAYLDRRKNEMRVNARNPFSVPNAKSDSIPAPLAAPRPAPSYNPPKEDDDEPTIEDTKSSIAPANNDKSAITDKHEPTTFDNTVNNVNNYDNTGINTNTVNAKDEGADFGAVSIGLASSTILTTIITLGVVIGIQTDNYDVIKYVMAGALICIPLLALVASIIAFTKHHGSKVAAIVGAVLAVFTLGVGGYAYTQSDALATKASNQISQRVQKAMTNAMNSAFSSSGSSDSGSISDNDSQSDTDGSQLNSSDESSDESSYYSDDTVSVSPSTDDSTTTDDGSQDASSDSTTDDSTTTTPDADSSAQTQDDSTAATPSE